MWSWLSKLVSFLLVLSLTLVVFTQVLNTTALSSSYVEGQLKAVNGYNRLSTAISDEMTRETLAAYPNIPGSENIHITPEVLQLRLKPYLEQLQQYAHGQAPAPTFDLSDTVRGAHSAGFPIPDSSAFAKPITLSEVTSSPAPLRSFDTIRTWSMIAGVVLTLLLGFVCYKRRRYVAPADVLMWTGATVATTGFILKLLSDVIQKWLHFNGGMVAITDVVRDLAVALIGGTAQRLFIVAAIVFVVGLVGRLAVHKIRLAE